MQTKLLPMILIINFFVLCVAIIFSKLRGVFMDPITHAMTGYAISHCLCSNKQLESDSKFPKKAFFQATILGALIPDADILVAIFAGQTAYFMNHRGISHSLVAFLFLPVFSALLAKLLHNEASFKWLLYGSFTGMLSHILFDLTNVYSTLVFWPFKDTMVSLGFMSIFDIIILAILFLTPATLKIKNLKKYRREIFIGSLLLITCYVGFKYSVSTNLHQYVLGEYNKGNIDLKSDSPVIKSSVLDIWQGYNNWEFIIETKESFIKGECKMFPRSISNVVTIEKPPLDSATKLASETPLGKYLLKFSQYVAYNEVKKNDRTIVRMSDLRFNTPKFAPSVAKHASLGGYTVIDSNNRITYWGMSAP